MKRFFLFTQRGMTDRFFCGDIYEAYPTDKIRFCGDVITFQFAEDVGYCKSFTNRKEADLFSMSQENEMSDSDEYARKAMEDEERYGC